MFSVDFKKKKIKICFFVSNKVGHRQGLVGILSPKGRNCVLSMNFIDFQIQVSKEVAVLGFYQYPMC